MSIPYKRSVSPHSLREDEEPARKSRNGFSGIFSFLKPKQGIVSSIFGDKNNENKELQIVQNEPLMNDFTSLKKRRVSLQPHDENGFVPRSSTLGNSIGRYQSFYNNLKTEKEERNNDLERRLSTAFDAVNENPKIWDGSAKDESPLVDLVSQEAMIQKIEDEEDEVESTSSESMDNGSNSPLIIEHEFAPLYKDSEGNLVRPPFINLDPRERYHLLQLKKSIEASEALQRRIKYMVNPKETLSNKISNSNKVETSTQTTNYISLETTSRFALKRKLQDRKYLKNTKRSKNNQGFFVGEFVYDIEDEPKKAVSKEYEGYLGNVSKPDFSANKNISQPSKTGTRINEAQDQSQDIGLNKFAKSTNLRAGLNESLLNNNKVVVSLDDDYLKNSKKMENVIKLNTNVLNNDNDKKSSDFNRPSSGFQFNINKDKIDSIISDRNETEEEKSSSTQNKKLFSGGTSSISNKDTPKLFEISSDSKKVENGFQFGSKPTTASSEKPIANESQPPKFSFGLPAKTTSEEQKLSLLFSTSKPLSTDKNDDKADVAPKAPLFSFGTSKTDSNPPISIGGDNKKKAEEEPKPAFKFGGNKDTSGVEENKPKPLFSLEKQPTKGANNLVFKFGGNDKNEASEPTKSFTFQKDDKNSESSSKPVLSFGTDATSKSIPQTASSFGGLTSEKADNADKTERPIFSFGSGNDKSLAVPFSFGKDTTKSEENTEKAPKPLFLASSNTPKNDSSTLFKAESKEPAPFTFGGTSIPKVESNKSTPASAPAFSFDKSSTSDEKKESTPAPAFSFGSSTNPNEKKELTPAPAFSFGSSTTASEKKESTPAPAFSFGGSSSTNEKKESTPVPAFSFGGSTNEVKEKTPSSLSFDTTKPPTTAGTGNTTSGFTFGKTGAPAGQTSSTAFSFGNTPSTNAASLPQTGQPLAFTFGKSPSAEPLKSSAPSFGAPPSAGASKPAFGFASDTKEPTPNPTAPQFTFGGPSQASGGLQNTSGSSTPASKFNFGQTSATFGATNSTPNFATANFSGFGSRPNSAMTNTRSNESTPQPFAFNAQPNQPALSNSSMSGMNNMNGMNAKNPASVFNFTGSASREATPDPASIFGGANSASRENTPFGGAPGNATFGAQPNPTPIVRTGRKIAQMRLRRR